MFKVLFSLCLIVMPLETIAADNKTVNPKVKLETEKGDIIIELYAAKAPVTVDSFIKHVNNYHYDGLIFHRVIKNFMIQTGGFTFDFTPRESDRPTIINESSNGLKNSVALLPWLAPVRPTRPKLSFLSITVTMAF